MMEKDGSFIQDQLGNEPFRHAAKTIIPVLEEEVIIEKKITEHEKVIVEKKVHTENIALNIPLKSEHYHIERVSLNEFIETPPPPVRQEGNTMIISVLKEVIVKKLLLVEEIRLTKEENTIEKKEEIPLKKEEVIISRKNIVSDRDENETSVNPLLNR